MPNKGNPIQGLCRWRSDSKWLQKSDAEAISSRNVLLEPLKYLLSEACTNVLVTCIASEVAKAGTMWESFSQLQRVGQILTL